MANRLVRPFHLAFPIKDIQSTRLFYTKLLGCQEGRSTERWIDFDFFGNQISAHVAQVDRTNEPKSLVDSVQVPLRHFGAILSWQQFNDLAQRLRDNKIQFVIEPQIRYPGKSGEQATMFFQDPSGNALEFKAFKNEDEVFEKQQ